MPVGAIISGAASLANNLIGSWNAKQNTDKTIKANKELAEYQYSKELEMWHKANEYNSPAAQMERFKAGGLNPNLVYGQGTPGNASTIPKYQAPKVDYQYRPPVDPLAMIGAYQDFRMKQAQTKAAEAEAEHAPSYFGERAKSMNYKEDKDFFGSLMDKMKWEIQSGRYGEEHRNTKFGHQLIKIMDDFGTKNAANEYQKSQMDFAKAKAANETEKINLIKAQGIAYDKQSQLMQKEIDNFLMKMWSGIITNGANTILKFK
jgi:hypothetical protein